MNIFRVRDFFSVLVYRGFCKIFPIFGAFGKRVRIVWPMRLSGVRNMIIGDSVTLGFGAFVSADQELDVQPVLTFGPDTRIGEFSHIICRHRVTFGRSVLVANRVFVSDCGHAFRDPNKPVLYQGLVKLGPVEIGSGTWIGENVCIIGCSIGEGCVIAANSVVTSDVPDHSVAAGTPARIVRRYCAEKDLWLKTDSIGSFLS